jgi:hypothetical protein
MIYRDSFILRCEFRAFSLRSLGPFRSARVKRSELNQNQQTTTTTTTVLDASIVTLCTIASLPKVLLTLKEYAFLSLSRTNSLCSYNSFTMLDSVIFRCSSSKTSSKTIPWMLKIACCLLLSVAHAAAQVSPLPAMQAHFGGVTYAGGMSYDVEHGVVYVTGQVGVNGCFVGLIKEFTWISRYLLPEPAVCQGLMIGEQQAVLLATAQEGGLYTDTRVIGSDKSTLYGLAMTLDIGATGDAQLSAKQHALMHLNQVQYPRSLTLDNADDNMGNHIFVVSMDSENKSEHGTAASSGEIPNVTPGGVTRFGSAYTMTVTKLLKEDFSVVWEKEFGLHSDQHGNLAPSVEVAQMIWNKVTLVVVGSTKGSGPAFGESDNEDIFHGFITKIDPETGRQWEASEGSSAKAEKRFSLGANDDDIDTHIMGVCSASIDADFIYVVGMSDPEGVSTPFMAKVDAVTLDLVWLEQLDERSSNAYGLACGVDGNHAYMAGIVEGGGTIAPGTTSYGGDDVFVLQLSLDQGEVQWMQQVGTSGDDRLAHGGSGLVVTDSGVLLYGDTSGDMYATAEHPSELFIAQIALDGSVPDTTESSGINNSGGEVRIVTPPRLDIDNTEDSDTKPPKPEVVPPPPKETESDIKLGKGSGYIGIFFMTLILTGVFMVGYLMQRRKGNKGTERALVFSYLQAFDVEDMDVRHSATGGWHGTYVGKLAQGESRSSAHSSIVKDSLFVDYDTTPSLGTSASTDLEAEDDIDRYIEGSLSYADRKANLSGKSGSRDPWGKDII